MDRRGFLAALAAGSALAGCISESSSGADGTSESGATTESDATTNLPTTTLPTEPTDRTTARETTGLPTTTTARTTTTATEPAAESTTMDAVTTESSAVEPTTTQPTTPEATDTPTATDTLTATGTPGAPTDTQRPGPPTNTGTSERMTIQAAPGDCPTYDDSVVRVVCYDAAPSDAPMVMEPSREALNLPSEIEFTLENNTDSTFETNFYSAGLDKFVEGEWFRIAPQQVPQPLTPLRAGESHTWTVSLSRDSSGRSSSESTLNVGGLGGGQYAFGIDGNFEDGTYERQTAFAATIEVRGDPIELTTTDAVMNVSVTGDVLTARWTGGNADGEYAREATYVLERTDEAPDTRLITEQLAQNGLRDLRPLRDALALATEHDVREVRLSGQTATSPPFGVQGQGIEYEGTAYAISASVTGTDVTT